MHPDSRANDPLDGATPARILDRLAPTGDDSGTRSLDGRPVPPGEPDACAAEPAPRPSPSDYPEPRVLKNRDVFEWHEDGSVAENYAGLGRRLAAAGDLFRNTGYAGGLLLGSPVPHVDPAPIRDAAMLAPVIADRQAVRVFKDGKSRGTAVPDRHLKAMLRSEVFLQQFLPVDAVDRRSRYLPDFGLTRPSYNDGGFGQRILHVGAEPWIEPTHDTIAQFLDVMAFASEADRTNAVAAALTVMLRNHWPGAKPCLVVTSTKSHGGKETVVLFAAGTTPLTSISYQATDWALERAFVGALKHNPDVGLVDVENARLDRGQKQIRSGFLERFITDPEPLLFSTGSGGPVRRRNDVVVAITSNFGTVSEDLMNRGLPIHLEPVGDIASRNSPIGNPKLEFLPQNRDRIEAELRGLIERWKREGRPFDASVKHPFTDWARTVGGILQANGFADFLGNYAERKTTDDPVRHALGLLGSARPDAWQRSAEWAGLVTHLGLARVLIPEAERDSDKGRERALGVILSAHQQETFHVETEDKRLSMQLLKERRRFEEGQEPSTRYRFAVLKQEDIPEDSRQFGGRM
jgi:hypothetical protein